MLLLKFENGVKKQSFTTKIFTGTKCSKFKLKMNDQPKNIQSVIPQGSFRSTAVDKLNQRSTEYANKKLSVAI